MFVRFLRVSWKRGLIPIDSSSYFPSMCAVNVKLLTNMKYGCKTWKCPFYSPFWHIRCLSQCVISSSRRNKSQSMFSTTYKIVIVINNLSPEWPVLRSVALNANKLQEHTPFLIRICDVWELCCYGHRKWLFKWDCPHTSESTLI